MAIHPTWRKTSDGIEIEWMTEHNEPDGIELDQDGLHVFTGCHGCTSKVLDDRAALTELRDALTARLKGPAPRHHR